MIVRNGALTLQVALEMKHIDLKSGNDVGLLSFDNLYWGDLTDIGITTVRQPTFQMGALASQLLIEWFKENDCEWCEQLFSGHLLSSNQP